MQSTLNHPDLFESATLKDLEEYVYSLTFCTENNFKEKLDRLLWSPIFILAVECEKKMDGGKGIAQYT